MKRERRPAPLLRPPPPEASRRGAARLPWFLGGALLGLLSGLVLGLALAPPPDRLAEVTEPGPARPAPAPPPMADRAAGADAPAQPDEAARATSEEADPRTSLADPVAPRSAVTDPVAPRTELTDPVAPRSVGRVEQRPTPIPAEPPRTAALPPRSPAPPPVGVAPRIVVHYLAGSAAGEGAARAVAAQLLQGGVPGAPPPRLELRPVAGVPSQRVVRYFHTEDAAAAARLAGQLGRGWAVQDFRPYEPSPSPQLLEVWLPDR